MMDGKVVVITGASSGIGAALAERVNREGGWAVMAARREPELHAMHLRLGGDSMPVVADVTRREDVERVRDLTLGRFGHIDVWVNNAGRGITRSVTELTDDDVDEMMSVNLKSALYGMQAVLPHFQARGRGHIINISSMLGRVPFFPPRAAYSASKHALNALTACLRMELRATHPGIHVSTVSPGVVATEFGVHARHGGRDSRQMPMAQPVQEVVDVIVSVIEHPRADVYTRPGLQQQAVAYFAAEDMAAAETPMPPAPGPPRT